jgi:hypothetical protein
VTTELCIRKDLSQLAGNEITTFNLDFVAYSGECKTTNPVSKLKPMEGMEISQPQTSFDVVERHVSEAWILGNQQRWKSLSVSLVNFIGQYDMDLLQYLAIVYFGERLIWIPQRRPITLWVSMSFVPVFFSSSNLDTTNR